MCEWHHVRNLNKRVWLNVRIVCLFPAYASETVQLSYIFKHSFEIFADSEAKIRYVENIGKCSCSWLLGCFCAQLGLLICIFGQFFPSRCELHSHLETHLSPSNIKLRIKSLSVSSKFKVGRMFPPRVFFSCHSFVQENNILFCHLYERISTKCSLGMTHWVPYYHNPAESSKIWFAYIALLVYSIFAVCLVVVKKKKC